MPLYEYRCKDCGEVFDKLRPVSKADDEILCPRCQSKKTERQLSTFATGACASTSRGFR